MSEMQPEAEPEPGTPATPDVLDDVPEVPDAPEAPDDSDAITIHTEDDEQIGRLAAYLSASLGIDVDPKKLQAVARRFVTPRPDEPTGLGAVVEDGGGVCWTRWAITNIVEHWISEDGTRLPYDGIDALYVRQDGWTRE